jgi:5-methylcytosine-specific restriction endonuclease McrA
MRYSPTKKYISWRELGLSDLKKVRGAYEKYTSKISEHKSKCDEVERQNRDIQSENQEIKQYEKQLEKDRRTVKRLTKQLEARRLSWFGTLLEAHIIFEGHKYGGRTRELISQLENARANMQRTYEKAPLFIHTPKVPMPRGPKDSTEIKISGNAFSVLLNFVKLDELESLIAAHEVKVAEEKLKVAKEKEKLHELHARVASNVKEKREQAKKFRRDLHKQLSKAAVCPYCGGLLSDSNAHLDHIYPISKGGLSTLKNLVFVCDRCNLDKSDSMLRKFLQQIGCNEQQVYDRLDILKKEF